MSELEQAPFKVEPAQIQIMKDSNTGNKSYCFSISKSYLTFLEHEHTIEQISTLRKFKSPYILNNIQTYLYDYQEGVTLYQKIEQSKINGERIDIKLIKKILKQLLQSLYHLHKNKILGRVFTTENIILKNDIIVMMNFGYISNIKLLNNIIPPEIKGNQHQYDIQLDIWLLGAVLYHLIKLKSIDFDKDKNQSIKIKTSSYPKELVELIEAMLILEPKNRITFHKLIQTSICQELLENEYKEYIQFYSSDLTNLFKNNIQMREEIVDEEISDFFQKTNAFQINNIQESLIEQQEINTQHSEDQILGFLKTMKFENQLIFNDQQLLCQQQIKYLKFIFTNNNVLQIINESIVQFIQNKLIYKLINECQDNCQQQVQNDLQTLLKTKLEQLMPFIISNNLELSSSVSKELKELYQKECQISLELDNRSSYQFLYEVIRPVTNYIYQYFYQQYQETKKIEYFKILTFAQFVHYINRLLNPKFIKIVNKTLDLKILTQNQNNQDEFYDYYISNDRTVEDYIKIINLVNVSFNQTQ